MIGRRWFLALGLAVALQSGTAIAADKLSVTVAVVQSSLFTGFHGVAVAGGFYEKHGLDVKVNANRSGDAASTVESVLRGQYDAYIGSPADATRINSRAIEEHQAPPIIVVAAGAPGMTTVVLRKDLPYKSLQDFKGLILAAASPATDHIQKFRYFLAQQNLSVESLGIRMVVVRGPDMPSALLTKQIDGFMQSEPTPSIAELIGNGKIVLSGTDLPASPSLSLSLRRDWAEQHRDLVGRMIAALQDATQFAKAAPKDQMVKIFADYAHTEENVAARVYDHTDVGLHDLHEMADAWFKVGVSAMKDRGEVIEPLAIKDVFDFSYGG